MDKIDIMLNRLQKSNFRGRFHLSEQDIAYIHKKGLEVIKRHAYDFVTSRLAPADITNDGKQTPMRGHPVFIAQHATATCCRTCLAKWHHIPQGNSLSSEQIEYVVAIIMRWINRQIN